MRRLSWPGRSWWARADIDIAHQTTGPHDYRVIVNPVIDGYSGKMSNLRHGLQSATHDFIVFSDSDTYAQPDVCRQLVSLHREGMDLISCLMRHVYGGNVWGRIYAAFWNYEHMAFIAPAILKHGRERPAGRWR
jgi:cellulose synthase/poly-beta-1,6-N-acetylglucosamine synthase-like glycosyltransferase